jgi:cytochrome c-type biogenesis protein CcmH/NrfG
VSRVSARYVVAGLVAVLVVYLALALILAVGLLTSGTLVGVVLGVAVLVIPLIGAWVVWQELRFGFATSRLGKELAAAGHWPVEDLPTRPSGRPEREAADAVFEQRRLETEAAPEDWQAWYRLGLAYADSGDRRRARAALRHAIALHDHP